MRYCVGTSLPEHYSQMFRYSANENQGEHLSQAQWQQRMDSMNIAIRTTFADPHVHLATLRKPQVNQR
jgi:hypothetical protein